VAPRVGSELNQIVGFGPGEGVAERHRTSGLDVGRPLQMAIMGAFESRNSSGSAPRDPSCSCFARSTAFNPPTWGEGLSAQL
jgi:hypothetical protein